MELPPRVKTQHPNRENIVHDANVPVPIETAFFLEDSQKLESIDIKKRKINDFAINSVSKQFVKGTIDQPSCNLENMSLLNDKTLQMLQ